jgi:hypothetical protein
MARIRHTDAQLAYDALTIEGNLLVPTWLTRVAQVKADSDQADADYRVPKGLSLRDEMGRYWRIAQAHWRDFAKVKPAPGAPLPPAHPFVVPLLREAFGFASIAATPPIIVQERVFPIGHQALAGRVPVVIAPAASGLDTPFPAFGDGHRRRSAFGLAQEHLNADDGALWGVATDGHTLRILRDNASLTRPAWIEADLARIFTEERYADFTALWLLLHETRFGVPGQPPADCALERWRAAGREEGTRAREHLREGVEEALLALGQGFIGHPANGAFRVALQPEAGSQEFSLADYYHELLRLVYRLIFLLAAEERGVLHAPGSEKSAEDLYREGYSMRHLRERSVRRNAYDRFGDVWDGLRIVLRGLDHGEPRLALPALGGIFAADACPHLDAARLENRHLLTAIFRLSWLRTKGGLERVNWRDMGPEELGSVYESLLELVPRLVEGGRSFAFASGGEAKGNARKTTGSYYTPDSLVQVLLDSALDPVVEATIAAHPADPAEALLGLAVVDPACGSGHFLLAAARRLAAHVARLRSSGSPTPGDYRTALRQVVGRSVFGVDLNPMAVELCRVGLWMEAVEPGRPLSFLDSHIRHGNALLGTTPELMEKGIPDAAWEPIEGDDKKVASGLKKRNKIARAGQDSFDLGFTRGAEGGTVGLVHAVEALDAAPDLDLGAVENKQRAWRALLESQAYVERQLAADAWCAAFVWKKVPGATGDLAPTEDVWRTIKAAPASAPPALVSEVRRLAREYNFFHWHLAFPQVFARGGFDVVLGNPPWEKVKLQEQEFFAPRNEAIANAPHAAARKKLIAELPQTDPAVWAEWCSASRQAEGQSHILRHSARYPLCGRGDVNTYAVFAEHNRSALGPKGRAGFIVPSGLATDDTTKDYFGALTEGRQLASFYSFENEEFIFPGIHHALKFALITVDRAGECVDADLLFFARQVADIHSAERHFRLGPADFVTLSPNTRTCPTFRSRRDAELNLALYRRTGVLLREGAPDGDPWRFRVHTRLWHMAEDAEAFRTKDALLRDGWSTSGNRFERRGESLSPLFEAKMLHHFDHRFGTYEGQTESQSNQGKLPELDTNEHLDPNRLTLPRYWVDSREVEHRLAAFWSRGWLLGWRKIARATDQRTVIAVLFPRAAAGDATPLAFPEVESALSACLYANLCSFVLDYCARQKVGGTNVTCNYVMQFPVLHPSTYSSPHQGRDDDKPLAFVLPRVLELSYTAWDLEPFAQDLGYGGPPFRWDPARRFLLRAELDATFFHLYGLSRDETDYVMDTFPVVRKNDEKAHGEYRTKRVILQIYDAMAEAARTGKPYQTRLDPPPADPRVAHPAKATTSTSRGST